MHSRTRSDVFDGGPGCGQSRFSYSSIRWGVLRPQGRYYEPRAGANPTRQLQPTFWDPRLDSIRRQEMRRPVIDSAITYSIAQGQGRAAMALLALLAHLLIYSGMLVSDEYERHWEEFALKYRALLQNHSLNSPSMVDYEIQRLCIKYMWDIALHHLRNDLVSALQDRALDRCKRREMQQAFEVALRHVRATHDVVFRRLPRHYSQLGLRASVSTHLLPLLDKRGPADHETLVPFRVPTRKTRRGLHHYDAGLSDYSKFAHLEGSGHDLIMMETYTGCVPAEVASNGSRAEEDPASDAEEMTMAEWRLGPGRKKSWKVHPKEKIPSGLQRRRGQVLHGAKSVKQISGSRATSQQDQRRGRKKDGRDRYVQKFQRGNTKQRTHHLWDDDFEEYGTSPHPTLEPRISIQAGEFLNTDAVLTLDDQPIAVTYNPSCMFYDNKFWAAKRGRREEAIYERIMADLPPRLPIDPTEKGMRKGKKHKQRGINKFKIPRFNHLEDLCFSLEGFWASLLEKSILLRKMVTGQELATAESYLKLYKTVEARRRQITRLEFTYATMDTRYKRVQNEVRGMKNEMTQLRSWLMSAMEQYQVTRLQSALHKDRFIYSLPQPKLRSSHQYSLLHKHGILGKGSGSIVRLLDHLSVDGDIMENIEEVCIKINNWYICQLSFLRQDLHNYTM